VDNDDIEDAIEGSTQELVSNEQVVARYETLVTLWTHRDAMTLQWTSLIISASAAVLAIVFGQKTPEQFLAIAEWRNWGDPGVLDVSIGAGMPVLVTGLLALPFAYAFYRSGAAMDSIAETIMELERDRFSIPSHALFLVVNRPGGWSTRRLIMRALATMAFSMVLLGSMMSFGVYGGCILTAVVGAVSVLYVRSDRFTRQAGDRSRTTV
jgi:signal transduction histidine kinase